MSDSKPPVSTVAYHPELKTVVEFRDVGGGMVADLPGGQSVSGRKAAELLNLVLSSDTVLVREVKNGAR